MVRGSEDGSFRLRILELSTACKALGAAAAAAGCSPAIITHAHR